jgi:hypothetical protein
VSYRKARAWGCFQNRCAPPTGEFKKLTRITVYVADLGRTSDGVRIVRYGDDGPQPITEAVWPEYLEPDEETVSVYRIGGPSKSIPGRVSDKPVSKDADVSSEKIDDVKDDFRSNPRKYIADSAHDGLEALLLEQVVALANHAKIYSELAGATPDPGARRAFINVAVGLLETQVKVHTAITHAHDRGRQEVIVRQQREEAAPTRSRRKRSDPREMASAKLSKEKAHA